MIKINGREYGLKLTVGAALAITEICPAEDLSKLNDALYYPMLHMANENTIRFIVALSEGYESAKAFNDPGYTPDPITRELLETVTLGELFQLRNEAIAVYNRDTQPSVETENEKKNEPAMR